MLFAFDFDGQNSLIKDHKKAECLNKFFAEIGHNLAEKIPEAAPVYSPSKSYPPVHEFREIMAFESTNFIRDMKSSNSCGTDGLTMKLVKYAGPSIIDPLYT